MEPGGIEVDEHGLRPPQDDVFRLHVPVDGADGVEHPQGSAHLPDDLPGLIGGEEGVLQQKAQGVAFDELLHHQVVPVLLSHLIDGGQVGTGVVQELLIHLRIAGKLPEDEALPGAFVADEADAAPGTFFDEAHQLIFLRQNAGEPAIHGIHC